MAFTVGKTRRAEKRLTFVGAPFTRGHYGFTMNAAVAVVAFDSQKEHGSGRQGLGDTYMQLGHLPLPSTRRWWQLQHEKTLMGPLPG